ncbi:MAG: hypothetical protein QOJ42_3880 [Acidobacteriaceae bacterium]|nr:hypothetical protein [Acidobacteriaceae bacterium]
MFSFASDALKNTPGRHPTRKYIEPAGTGWFRVDLVLDRWRNYNVSVGNTPNLASLQIDRPGQAFVAVERAARDAGNQIARTSPSRVARVLRTSKRTRIIPRNGTRPATMMIVSNECVASP